MDQPIEIGNFVKDTMTGYSGVATAKCEYINGHVQFYVETGGKDGKPPEGSWFYEDRLVHSTSAG